MADAREQLRAVVRRAFDRAGKPMPDCEVVNADGDVAEWVDLGGEG